MSQEDLNLFHADPANWRWSIFYVCRQDPRLIVPKRIQGLGWTLNFGRPMAAPFFLFIVALIPGGVALARFFGAGAEARLAIKLLLAACIIILCYWLARSPAKISAAPESKKRDP